MPAQVIVYTTDFCPYCTRAKALLRSKDVEFREINIETRAELRGWLVEASGQRTLPQVFVNGQSLGGFTDVVALDRAGGLDPLLARDASPSDPAVRL